MARKSTAELSVPLSAGRRLQDFRAPRGIKEKNRSMRYTHHSTDSTTSEHLQTFPQYKHAPTPPSPPSNIYITSTHPPSPKIPQPTPSPQQTRPKTPPRSLTQPSQPQPPPKIHPSLTSTPHTQSNPYPNTPKPTPRLSYNNLPHRTVSPYPPSHQTPASHPYAHIVNKATAYLLIKNLPYSLRIFRLVQNPHKRFSGTGKTTQESSWGD